MTRWGGGRRVIALVTGFAASTMLVGIASVVTIPAILIGAGESGWSTYIVAQSIGAGVNILTMFGWGIAGPASVAPLTPGGTARRARESLRIRSIAFAISASGGAVLAWMLTGGSVAAVLITLGMGLYGFGFGWVFIGRHEPVRLLCLDAIPRAGGMILGAVAVWLTGNLAAFGIAVISGAVIATALPLIALGPKSQSGDELPQSLRSELKTYTPSAIAGAISLAYFSLPMILLAILLPSALAAAGLADRIQKLLYAGIQPISQFSQGYVARGAASEVKLRILRGLRWSALIAPILGLLVALLGPLAGEILSAGAVNIGYEFSVAIGIAVAATLVSQYVGTACFPALGRTTAVPVSAAAGAIAAVAALPALIHVLGGSGAIWTVASSEVVVVAIQLCWLFQLGRRSRSVTARALSEADSRGSVL